MLRAPLSERFTLFEKGCKGRGAGVIISATRRGAQASLPTRYGTFEMFVYDTPEHKEHVALT
jgi:hypothetical protein